jgi:hypothetical protein
MKAFKDSVNGINKQLAKPIPGGNTYSVQEEDENPTYGRTQFEQDSFRTEYFDKGIASLPRGSQP